MCQNFILIFHQVLQIPILKVDRFCIRHHTKSALPNRTLVPSIQFTLPNHGTLYTIYFTKPWHPLYNLLYQTMAPSIQFTLPNHGALYTIYSTKPWRPLYEVSADLPSPLAAESRSQHL